jgi:hypothetical protein
MNRNDLVFVGIRLLGLFLLVAATLGFVGLALSLSRGGARESGAESLFMIGSMGFLGLMLLLGAPGIANWLQRKDDALARDNPSTRANRPLPKR